MTSQGSAHGRFARFITAGNVSQAEMAMREIRSASLADALSLLELYVGSDSERLACAVVVGLAAVARSPRALADRLGGDQAGDSIE